MFLKSETNSESSDHIPRKDFQRTEREMEIGKVIKYYGDTRLGLGIGFKNTWSATSDGTRKAND